MTTPIPPPPPDRPAVVLLNAGVIHRVGANRVNVRMSRVLARAGFTAFRFDLSGIGDSDTRQDVLNLEEAVRADIGDALAHLTTTQGITKFILFGLCSGANNGFRYAVGDDRVKAVVLIDPVAFRTLGHHLRFFGRRVLRPRVWWNAIRGRNAFIRNFMRRALGRSASVTEFENAYPVGPGRDEMRTGLRTLIDRDVEALVIYTGGLEWQYNYHGQFRDMFPEEARSPRIRVEFLGDSDHTFSAESHKQWLADLALRWISQVAGWDGMKVPEPAGVLGGT